MTHEEAKKLKKDTPVMYRGSYGDEDPCECKWIAMDYHPNGNVIGLCVDHWGNERWGFLHQFDLFD